MLKWLLAGLLVLVVLIVGVLLALPLLLDTPAIQAYVSQAAGHALGRPVKFNSLSISALPLPTVKLRGLHNVDWQFIFSCAAHNLIRLPRLIAQRRGEGLREQCA